MRNDAEVQNAARDLFVGVAPERRSELFELWKKYSLRFNVLTDAGPDGFFVFDAGAYRDVRFNNRAMRAFWLASFIAWEGYRAIAEDYEADNIDLSRFRDMVDCFNRILTEEDSEGISLPEGIPDPGDLPDGKKMPQMRATAELAMFATGWAFLHEVRHLRHQQERTGATAADPPEKWREEELSCDLYATQFLLDRADEYAVAAGVPVSKVRQKREIGIYFGLFALVLIGAGYWHETDTHPAMERRIAEVMKKMDANGIRPTDAIAHMAFVALWTVYPEAPGPFKLSSNELRPQGEPSL